MEDNKKRYKLHQYEIVNAKYEIGIYLGENCADAVNMKNVFKDYFNTLTVHMAKSHGNMNVNARYIKGINHF